MSKKKCILDGATNEEIGNFIAKRAEELGNNLTEEIHKYLKNLEKTGVSGHILNATITTACQVLFAKALAVQFRNNPQKLKNSIDKLSKSINEIACEMIKEMAQGNYSFTFTVGKLDKL